MANIAITNRCNLNCDYCFAHTFKDEETQNITVEQLDKILDFLSRTKERNVGVIGGEPTLHPNFKEIFYSIGEYCVKYNGKPTLYTNGILLHNYIRLLSIYKPRILLNINDDRILNADNKKNLIKSLDALSAFNMLNMTTFGINIYNKTNNFDKIINLCNKYSHKTLRCSCVAPTNPSQLLNKEDYYLGFKDIFLQLIRQADENDITINIDCNHIPYCYFNEDEQRLIDRVSPNYKSRAICNPVIDITPNMCATSCFGTYEPIDINQFENLNELYRYFLFGTVYDKTVVNNFGKCNDCEKFKCHTCQGGCLKFADINKE